MLGIALLVVVGGCDLTSIGDLGDASKVITSERGTSVDAIMSQLWTRDQLKDGTGVNCPTARQVGNGQGQGDLLRLRDGSCQQ